MCSRLHLYLPVRWDGIICEQAMGREGVLYTKTLRCSAPTISSIYTLQLSLDQKKISLNCLYDWKLQTSVQRNARNPDQKWWQRWNAKMKNKLGGGRGDKTSELVSALFLIPLQPRPVRLLQYDVLSAVFRQDIQKEWHNMKFVSIVVNR